MADDWDERPHTVEEVKAMLQHRKETAMKRDKTLSHSFSQQVLISFIHYSVSSSSVSMPSVFHELIFATLSTPHRFGGVVGAHQLVMKTSSKRGRNGSTVGWRRSRGIPGEEPQPIKETPSKPWKWIPPSLTHTWLLLSGGLIKISITNTNNKDPVPHSTEATKIYPRTTPLPHPHHRKPGLSKSGRRALVSLEKREPTSLHLKHQA